MKVVNPSWQVCETSSSCLWDFLGFYQQNEIQSPVTHFEISIDYHYNCLKAKLLQQVGVLAIGWDWPECLCTKATTKSAQSNRGSTSIQLKEWFKTLGVLQPSLRTGRQILHPGCPYFRVYAISSPWRTTRNQTWQWEIPPLNSIRFSHSQSIFIKDFSHLPMIFPYFPINGVPPKMDIRNPIQMDDD